MIESQQAKPEKKFYLTAHQGMEKKEKRKTTKGEKMAEAGTPNKKNGSPIRGIVESTTTVDYSIYLFPWNKFCGQQQLSCLLV